jgi:hypothetical protein
VRLTVRSLVACALALAAADAPSAGAATLRLDGIGPLRLGMTRAAAVSTGWLAHRGRGCPLGGTPPITYRVDGRQAPRGVRGTVEFSGGRLTDMTFTAGVRTTAGVTVGHTTPARMAARYRTLGGFRVASSFEETFGGTFVTVSRDGDAVLGGFAQGPRVTILAIPTVPVCE